MSYYSLKQYLSRLQNNRDGNVAMLFAVSALPMMLMVGAAVDYGSSLNAKARLQSAADSIALAIVREPRGTPLTQLQAIAERRFAASFRQVHGTTATVSVTVNGQSVRVGVNGAMPTSFMKLMRQDQISLSVTSTAVYAKSKIQLALALDNTGSMAQLGKMPALKSAVNDLITKLQATSAAPGDIKASIVPFNTQVRVSASHSNAAWLRWGVRLENPNFSASQATAPISATWGGCIADRDQNYDISSERPIGGTSNYVAAQCHYGPLAQMSPLTSNLESVRTTVNSMTPTGSTNVTIGLSMALSTLRADSPFGDASSNDPEVQKFLILLTDGNNTQNRWGGDGRDGNSYAVDIDERLRQACAAARATDIQIFTIRVVAGNEAVLRSCATNPSMYYPVTTAADLGPVFTRILDQISRPRLTM